MGWIQRAWDRINPPLPPETRAIQAWNVYGDAEPGTQTHSGTTVNETTAFKLGVAYAAMTLIADGVSLLPPTAYKVNEDGSEDTAELPRWISKPHPEIRRFDIFNQIVLSMLAWGDAFCMLVRRPSDLAIIGLDVLDPADVTVEWDPVRSGRRRYKYNNIWYSSFEIMHIQGPTLPGRPRGMSIITQAREAIGLGLTLEEFGARYFSQGSQAKIVLEVPKTLDTDEALRIVKTYERFHKGKGNWHRPAIASGGTKLHNISIPPNDAQFLESRGFQGEEIARWFRVPPHRVGIMSKSTSWGSGLAEENRMMLQHTYHPWIQRIEDALSAYSPGGEGLGTLIRLKTEELLNGTFKDQAEVWLALYQGGLTTKNESRRKIGLSDIEGGDELIDPLLMKTFSGRPLGIGMGGGGPGDTGGRTPEQDRKRKQDDANSA